MAAVSDAVMAFIAAMEAHGVAPAEPIAKALLGGGIIRFQVQGDRPGRRNGWAVFHADWIPAGAFGCNKRGIRRKWRAAGVQRRFTAAERAEHRLRRNVQEAERQREREALHAAAAERAEQMLKQAGPADPQHLYLLKKRVPGEGFAQAGNILLAPMRDAMGKLWNVQRIYPNGSKLFLKGGRTNGLMWCVGDPDGLICIGEGAGTMAAVRRATGHAVVAAFSAKNLEPVARAIASRWADCQLVICADDDAHLVDHPTISRNLGLEAAHAAAAAVGAKVAVPPRSDDNA
jgi:putative DNA primase/helicase